MNTFTKDSFKKLLLLYGIAVALVLVYFIIRLLFQEEKKTELKSFHTFEITTPEENPAVTLEKRKEDTRFMMLPRR